MLEQKYFVCFQLPDATEGQIVKKTPQNKKKHLEVLILALPNK